MFVEIFQNRIQKRKNIVEREDTFQQYSEMFWNILITISISKYHTYRFKFYIASLREDTFQ